jgi:8-oxo-dGTP diphosphatase
VTPPPIWTAVPTFGSSPAGVRSIVRPSAYAIIGGYGGTVAIVRTPQGLFLPGGGIEAGESPHESIVREVREECGLIVRVGEWSAHAVDFIYSLTEREHFEKRCTFHEAHVLSTPGGAIELDHELLWMAPAGAIAGLGHPSHRWAVARWLEAYHHERSEGSRSF